MKMSMTKMLILMVMATVAMVTAEVEADLETKRQLPGVCLPLATLCVPNNPTPGQQCCTAQGQTCQPNPLAPGTFHCNFKCFPLNNPCLMGSTRPGQMCCAGLVCGQNPVLGPGHFSCRPLVG